MKKRRFDGAKVRRMRLPGMSQTELAKKSGCSLLTISNAETGKITPRESTVAAIAMALGCEVNQLYILGEKP